MASRASRFEDGVTSVLSSAKEEAENLKGELQEWLDNMPENLQQSAKAEELQEAIDAIDSVISSIEEAESNCGDVSFPGMF